MVVIGYFDTPKAVNLDFLLLQWIENGESLDCYPYADDNTQVRVIEHDHLIASNPDCIYVALRGFEDCAHIKVWLGGSLLSKRDIELITEHLRVHPFTYFND